MDEPAEAGTRAEVPGSVLRVWAVPVRLFLGVFWVWNSLVMLNPNLPVAGILLPVIGIIIGIAILLGFATRAFAALGILLQIFYWIDRGSPDWGFAYPLIIATHILIILTDAGRSLGLDIYTSRRWPKALIW